MTRVLDALLGPTVLATLDPPLGDLRRVLDPAVVARHFERCRPGNQGRASAVTACVLEDAKWTPSTSCVATFRLVLGQTSACSTIGVVELRPQGVRYCLFDEDPLLPGLAIAADPHAAGPALAEALARPVDACLISPVRYRPGERCVLRYELVYRSSREVVFGKVTPLASRLAATVDGIEAARPADAEQLVPPVRALLPALDLVVQADGGPETLARELPLSASRHKLLLRTGALLATLHGLSRPPAARRTLADDAAAVEAELPAARHADERTADRILTAIQRLLTLAGEATVEPVPTHGAFRLDQVAVCDARPLLLDLDGYCWAEPSRDLGNVRAYLRWKAMRRPELASYAAVAQQVLEDGYERRRVTPIDRGRVRLHETVSMLKIAVRRYRNLDVDEWPLVPALVEQSLQLLGTDAGAVS